MKPALIFIASVTLTTAAYAEPSEEKLANLQIEKAGLLTKYGSSSPRIAEIDTQISSLSRTANIFNQKYYTFLKERLISLKSEQAKLLYKFSRTNPAVVPINAEISFIENALKGNAG